MENYGHQGEVNASSTTERSMQPSVWSRDKTPAAQNAPLPRAVRRRRRSAADRGLPPGNELVALAKSYLDQQRKLWPQFGDLLQQPTDEVLAAMAADFVERHRGGQIEAGALKPFTRSQTKLGGAYNRYSCENSNPLSINDQLVNILVKAQAESRFIPWGYVYADYSVTGLDATRQGYQAYKALLANKDHLIETTYIDDFTRASRDDIEWWKLAALSKRLNKRMIGASDGFDVSSPDWDIKLTVYGLVSRLHIKGLREKVRRGMKGAARRGTSIGKPSLGFTRRAKLDAQGNVVTGADGLPIYEPCIDPETKDYRVMIFDLFVNRGWTAYKISRHFSQLGVDGWKGWTTSAITDLLRNPSGVGVFIWNQYRSEFNHETNKSETVANPRSEWVFHINRDLAIVPLNLWKAARRKLASIRRANPNTGRKPTKNEYSASTLFSGTLFCSHCGQELKLIRSTPSYKQMGCLNGTQGHHECALTTSKSVRVIEESLLTFLRDKLLSEDGLSALVVRVNSLLAEEAAKPQVDLRPINAEIRRIEGKIPKLVAKIEEAESEELSQPYHARVMHLQKELNDLRTRKRDAEAVKHRQIKPLKLEQALAYLSNLRELLNQDVAPAAEAVRQLTGQIKIRQEPIPGKKRSRWIASFSPDLWRAIRFANGSELNSPVLSGVSGDDQSIEVVLEKIPAYEALAPKFKQLRDGGSSITSIASAHGLTRLQVKYALDFAATGKRPTGKSGKRTGKGGKAEKYRTIADEVLQMRDGQKRSFESIAKYLEVSVATVHRAYDHARPEAAKAAAEKGGRLQRGTYSHIGEERFAAIRKLLKKGKPVADIAKTVQCGVSTVYRVKKELEGASG